MNNPKLNEIISIINGIDYAKDYDRVFTYIEFVKCFGYENNVEVFIREYKEYLIRWANYKKESITQTNEEFVNSKLVDILKSITLDYSSYEEQDFISKVDLKNKTHLKALLSLYSRKIRQITQFYNKKRNEAQLIVRKNSFKGSSVSIEQIIYDKICDFVFSNRNVIPSYIDIKRDLMISIENYIDVYSEYFDIPRNKQFTDKSRAEMLSANINDIDYRVYLDIELVISELLFSGDVYLEEIPLIAQLGVDLSVSCVGDMLALKNTLLENTQINRVPLTEQVALKRKLYEKYLGCDLYYMYVDLQGNIQIDKLCEAENPTGNLLNCSSADTATIANEQLMLMNQIGLFFKPDKLSILKVNAKEFTWSVDTDVIQNDTMYIFPDPNRYGDIGNNKLPSYPLIMEYDFQWDIKNISSGEAKHDPLLYLTEQQWKSYYSKQNDDFKILENRNYEYSFTSLANKGFLSNYQKDIWGNEWGIIKGLIKKTDGSFEFYENYLNYKKNEVQDDNTQGGYLLLNGGYFKDIFDESLEFDYESSVKLGEYYKWSGLKINQEPLNYDFNEEEYKYFPMVSFGDFSNVNEKYYHDHYQIRNCRTDGNEGKDNITKEEIFYEKVVPLNSIKKSFTEVQQEEGDLFIKLISNVDFPPIKVNEVLNVGDKKPINFFVKDDVLIFETIDEILFYPYSFDGQFINENLQFNKELIKQEKSENTSYYILYNEKDGHFYISELSKNGSFKLHKFNSKKYEYNKNLIVSELEIQPPKNDKIKHVLSFNNKLGNYLLAFAYNQQSGKPCIYECKFKAIDQGVFDKTVIINEYSV